MTAEDQQEPVELTYSTADILALNLLIWPFWLSVIAVFAAILIAVPVILRLIDGYSLDGSLQSVDWWFTGMILAILVAWLIVVTASGHWLRRKRGLHGPLWFWLTDEGVAVRNRQMDLVVFWTAIRSIKLTESRIFLFMTRRSALIVPQRAFQTEAQFQAFATAAQDYWRKGHRS